MSKYPDECPVFEFKGKVYEGRPDFSWGNDVLRCGSITIVMSHRDDGREGDIRVTSFAKPLTRAARELLKWSSDV
jgi:hypothetical protein